MMQFVAILCGILLILVTFAFIFSERFRKDVLAGEGETQVLGILNAKGATIVVLFALLIGGMLYASGKASITISNLSKIVPEEAPNLSKVMHSDIQRLKKAHIALVQMYLEEKRKRVKDFFENEWLPEFSKQIADDPKVRESLAQALASERKDQDLSLLLAEMNSAQQKVLLHKRHQLLAPINEIESAILSNIDENYQRILESNEAITNLLNSLR
ncbi:hypothetical protein KA005_81970 [bacterium]|nr:hypothetical protein [bacterium]